MSYAPFAYRSMFIAPFGMDGQTKSGIVLEHHRLLPKIYGRVTQVHPTCRTVRPGDWVVYLPERPTKVKSPSGPLWALDERQILGIVEPGDGHPWFAPPEENNAVHAGPV
jgi:hypothetical protein